MQGKRLHRPNEKFILPHFGISGPSVAWNKTEKVGPDEFVHYFSVEDSAYALIFEDAGGLGADEEFVEKAVELKDGHFEYVKPISFSDYSPSFSVKPPTPYKYRENVTGMFTLIKL
jgi:hypothetical protein